MHKFIVEDSTKCFTAMPDYVLILLSLINGSPVTSEGLKKGYSELHLFCLILQAGTMLINSKMK